MTIAQAKQALKHYFGYDSFRPLQAEVIDSVLDQQDVLVIMPTGGGKSICYQIPALINDGLCIVVSPLIALMKDQVEGLRQNGVAAAFINSSQSYQQQEEVMTQAIDGQLKLLYVSPERLCSGDFGAFLSRIRVNLIAIDEAHCISAWGHDFRPEYTQLAFLKQQFPHIPLMALTATADRLTREDILRQLRLNGARVFLDSFDRPNLSLNVLPGQNRFRQILDFIRLRPQQSGIIYCISRKRTEQLAAKLQEKGIDAAFYHAGMGPRARSSIQESFINDEIPIICATIAFGMGIDKSNVRWIIHYNLPKNLENYYQEIGRAGRDGLKSDTLLFYSYADVMLHRRFLEESGQREIKEAKLERIQQYAEAQICRRKILLNYFGENLSQDCGNCDVCKNPPSRFDGTVLAQKALSAIARMREQVGMRMLIDVLRGSARKEIMEKGYHQIKTYGAGRDLPPGDWQQYLLQMLNMGLLEIARAGQVLRLTQASREVLFEGRKVELVRFADIKKRAGQQQKLAKPKSKAQLFTEGLFERLKALRLQWARQEDIAPYLVFTDATLEEMVSKLPTNEHSMRAIAGVSEHKWQQYGPAFITAILDYVEEQEQAGEGYLPKGGTYLLTYQLYRKGYSIEEMARARELHPNTIYGHLAHLYTNGHEDIQLLDYLHEGEISRIDEAIRNTGYTSNVKPVFDYLNGEIDYFKIRLYMAHIRKTTAGSPAGRE
ncbi:MAG: DNA helicase RecQ [Bacteroidetes bacterium]|nr:MAG: DNA helicase RecQ [Bacteroidota bacterium]